METTMTTNQLPQTDSIQELAHFWDTHDLTDYEAELEEVKEPVFKREDASDGPQPIEELKAVVKRANRSRHYTSWAGVLATAAELSRRSYDVTITLGNTPTTDLLAAAPDGPAFRVEVKSASTPNFVPIQKTVLEGPEHSDLLFIIVLVPRTDEQPFRFFVMTHADVLAAWKKERKVTRSGQPYKAGWEGLSWSAIRSFEGCWHKLPGIQQLRAS
jgi:hypothetical protein